MSFTRSIFNDLTSEQQEQVSNFTQAVYAAKVLNEIYKMIFKRGVYARFLVAHEFNQGKALSAIEEYAKWRQMQQVDMLLDHDFMGKEDAIREFMPTGFHEIDRDGRPIMIINAGQFKLKELLEQTNLDNVAKFIFRELEHAWREKFDRCEQEVGGKVDQLRLIVDMKGATLKLISNKSLNEIWKAIIKEVSLRFPEFVHTVHVVNAPMFFEAYF